MHKFNDDCKIVENKRVNNVYIELIATCSINTGYYILLSSIIPGFNLKETLIISRPLQFFFDSNLCYFMYVQEKAVEFQVYNVINNIIFAYQTCAAIFILKASTKMI